MTPTQRSLEYLRDMGYHVTVVERWNPFAKIRQDLWGFVDLLCLRDSEVKGVQVTSYSNLSARIKKISEHENVGIVRKAGIVLEVHGWRKRGKHWEVKIVNLS